MSRIRVFALAALLLATPAFAADNVTLYKTSSSLSFQPQVNAAGATLIVSGPDGFLSRQEFDSASAAAFQIDGDMLDGTYSYELILHPKVNRATLEAMDEARVTGDAVMAEYLGAVNNIEPVAGTFAVRNGAIVTEQLVESASAVSHGASGLQNTSDAASLENVSAAAQVFTTDVIVQGSECVGFDCVSSESFGFDTLRLKENNLRIHFNDTSSSASFPGNDWRITINDSTNGGAEYFAVEDATGGKIPVQASRLARSTTPCTSSAAGDVGVGTANAGRRDGPRRRRQHPDPAPGAKRFLGLHSRRPGTWPATRRTSSSAT